MSFQCGFGFCRFRVHERGRTIDGWVRPRDPRGFRVLPKRHRGRNDSSRAGLVVDQSSIGEDSGEGRDGVSYWTS